MVKTLCRIITEILKPGSKPDISTIRVVSVSHNNVRRVIVSKRVAGQGLSVAVKYTRKKPPPTVTETISLGTLFCQERFIYLNLKPFYENVMKEFGIVEKLPLTKCYGFYNTSAFRVLMFDDLDAQNFLPHDEGVPFDLAHTKLVLEVYAKWHGISLVARHIHQFQYIDLIMKMAHNYIEVLLDTYQIKYIQKEFGEIKAQILDADERLKDVTFTNEQIKDALKEMAFSSHNVHVVIHSDCRVLNYRFRYQENSEKPAEVKIIDWQLAGISSPVFDLSHLIYCCSDTAATIDVDILLRYYHDKMRSFVSKFNLNLDMMFPFQMLQEHWKDFAHFGLLVSSQVIRDYLCTSYCKTTCEYMLTAEDEVKYKERVKSNYLHYLHNKD